MGAENFTEIMDVCKTAEESAQSANMLPDYYILFWHALCHGQTPQQSLNRVGFCLSSYILAYW